METRAKYAVVGGFTLAVLLGAFAFIWWFAGSRAGSDRVAYLVRFPGAVSGLSTGASVLFNGLRVGEVTTLDLAEDDPNVVVARIEVQPRTPVKTDTIARLEFTGLTGIASVQLTGASLESPPLKGERGKLPVIQAARSDFQNLLETAQRVSGKVDAVVERIEKLVADNAGAAGRTIRNTEAFTGALAENAPEVSRFLATTAATAERIGRFSEAAEKLTGDLDKVVTGLDVGTINRSLANVEAVTGALAKNADSINGVVADAGRLVRRLDGSAAKLDTAIAGVANIVTAVDPAQVGRVVEQAEKLAGSLNSAVAGIDAEAVRRVVAGAERTVANAEAVSGALAKNAGAIDGIVADAGRLVSRLDGTAGKLDTAVAGVAGIVTAVNPAQVGRVVDRAEALATSLTAAVNGIDVGAVNRTVANAEAVSGALAKNAGAIDAIVADTGAFTKRLNGTGERLDAALGAVTGVVSAIDPGQVNSFVAKAEALANDLGAAVKGFDAGAVNRTLANAEAVSAALAANKDAITGFVADAASLARRLQGSADKLDAALTGVAGVLTGVEPVRVGRIVENADKFAASLGGNAEAVNQAIKDAAELTAKLNASANRVDSVLRGAEGLFGSPETKGTITEAKGALVVARDAFTDFGAASRAVRTAAANLDKQFAGLSAAVSKLSASGQREVEGLANDARRTLNDLNRTVRGIEKNPQQFLTGPRGSLPEYRSR